MGNANHLMTPDEVAQAHYKTFNSSWDYPLAAPAAAAAKPGLTWVSATEGYFTLPVSQQVYYTANGKTATADAWGLGLRLGYAFPGFWWMK